MVRARLNRLVAAAGPRRAALEVSDAAPQESAGEAEPRPPETRGDDPSAATPPANPAERLRAALRLSKKHAWAVALLVLVGVVMSSGWALRARAVEVSAPVQVSSPAPGNQGAAQGTPSPTPTPTPAQVTVHVYGAVVRPGVVSVPAPARVRDVIAAAGGLRPDADPAELNLAALVGDGAQVVIGTLTQPRGEVRAQGAASQSETNGAPAPSIGTVLDLNTATVDQLDQVPGVGPVTAQAIVAWRGKHGRFSKVEELREVDGVGPKTYAQIAPHVRV